MTILTDKNLLLDPQTDDVIYVVDVSDPTDVAAGSSKKMPLSALDALFASLLGKAGGKTIVGGTAAGDKLTLQGTSGTGTPTGVAFDLNVGDNGDVTALSILNNGKVGFGVIAPLHQWHFSAAYQNFVLDCTGTNRQLKFSPTAGGVDSVNTVLNFNRYTDQNVSIGGNSTACVVIGGNTPDTNALLDLTSTTKAFLPPRMTSLQRAAIATPSAGMVVFDTDLAKLCVYTTAWETVTSAAI